MKRYIAIFVLTLTLGGCRPLWVGMVDPQGPPEYRLGWEDGCDSGLSAEGGWDYKMMYGFKKRPEMAANEQYKQAWNEGFSYCRFSLASSSKDTDWKNIGW